MNQKYSPFRKVSDPQLLSKLEDFLKANQIGYQLIVENDASVINVSITELERLEKLMLDNNELFVTGVPDDLYLRGFSDKELTEILLNPGDWGAIDYHLSVKILRERGLEVTPEFLKGLR